jgi:hypothetical protein
MIATELMHSLCHGEHQDYRPVAKNPQSFTQANGLSYYASRETEPLITSLPTINNTYIKLVTLPINVS